MNIRRCDERGEKALGVFLDKYFYPEFIQINGLSHAERIYKKDDQKKGVDLIIHNKSGKRLLVDEKAQLHYIGRAVPSFAFELSFYHKESQSFLDGWFVSEDNVTNAYMLIWINDAKTDMLNRITAEDFRDLTVFFVTKQKLYDYLKTNGYPTQQLKSLAETLRQISGEDSIALFDDVRVKLSHTEGGEEPINIVIPRSVLEKLAYACYNVTKDGVQKKATNS